MYPFTAIDSQRAGHGSQAQCCGFSCTLRKYKDFSGTRSKKKLRLSRRPRTWLRQVFLSLSMHPFHCHGFGDENASMQTGEKRSSGTLHCIFLGEASLFSAFAAGDCTALSKFGMIKTVFHFS
ncbi:MAG: hypothetical protein ABF868_07475 [Sporolactobacillus sp.]